MKTLVLMEWVVWQDSMPVASFVLQSDARLFRDTIRPLVPNVQYRITKETS